MCQCKMPELQINKFVDPAFYTDHNSLQLIVIIAFTCTSVNKKIFKANNASEIQQKVI